MRQFALNISTVLFCPCFAHFLRTTQTQKSRVPKLKQPETNNGTNSFYGREGSGAEGRRGEGWKIFKTNIVFFVFWTVSDLKLYVWQGRRTQVQNKDKHIHNKQTNERTNKQTKKQTNKQKGSGSPGGRGRMIFLNGSACHPPLATTEAISSTAGLIRTSPGAIDWAQTSYQFSNLSPGSIGSMRSACSVWSRGLR